MISNIRPTRDDSDGSNGTSANTREEWPEKAQEFLDYYAVNLNLSASAKGIGKGRTTIHRWRERWPGFKAAIKAVEDEQLDRMAAALMQTDDEGMMLKVLARLRPETWSERRIISGKIEHEHSGIVKVDGSIPIEERKEIYRLSYEAIANRESQN